MNKSMGKCALLGGFIVFIWGMLSWMLLPWHMTTTHKFINEEQVANVIKANAPESGIYFLPSCNMDMQAQGGKKTTQKKEHLEQGIQLTKERMKQGPNMFASVSLTGMDPDSVKPFIGYLIVQIIGACIAAYLLSRTKALKYMERVWFVALIGLFAGIVSELPSWIWLNFATSWTLVSLLDLLIGWFLAGLVMAKLSSK